MCLMLPREGGGGGAGWGEGAHFTPIFLLENEREGGREGGRLLPMRARFPGGK
jgi:hypothetical protein